MPDIKDLIEVAESLPVEERTHIIDSLLKSINPIDPEIDKAWIKLANKRLEEVRLGKAKLVDGEEVFDKIKDRFKS
ncbi:addiction module protein [candidate division KSB1 bacterium]|nr:addiction module protein [candidate division KSB1 bacterium]